MKVIAPYFEILEDLDKQSLPVRIEGCGRICYKSEDNITPESADLHGAMTWMRGSMARAASSKRT